MNSKPIIASCLLVVSAVAMARPDSDKRGLSPIYKSLLSSVPHLRPDVPHDAHNDGILHNLALELAGEWGLMEDDMDMYLPPNLETTQAPMVIVAATNKAKEKIVGYCTLVDNLGDFSFGGVAQEYLIKYQGKNPMDVDISRAQIKVLDIIRQPAHGQLLMDETDPYGGGIYRPNQGFLGKDRAEAIVSVGQDVVRVVYTFVVQTEAVDNLRSRDDSAKVMKKLCPRGFLWKISEMPAGSISDSATAYHATPLQSLLSGLDPISFADLPGASLGQANSTNITLDDNAAGYGWFIDYTPYLNEEFLPTSSPYIWTGNTGSVTPSN
jgi:hypothetical protein